MTKRKQSDGASRRPRRPSPERNDEQPGASRRPRRPSPERNDEQPGASRRPRRPLPERNDEQRGASRRPRRPSPERNDEQPGASRRPRRPSPERNDEQRGASRRPRRPSPERNDEQPGASRRPRRPSPERNDEQPGSSRRPRRPSSEGNDKQPGNSTKERSPDELKKLLVFVRKVEEYFKDVDPDKNTAFVNLMLAGKQGRVSRPCVISQVKELFRGHKEMLILFNKILLTEYKIIFKEDVPEIQDLAKLYVDKVKMRSSPSVFSTFMHILYLYKERALTSNEVDQEVEVLFAKSCDLLEEYDCLRPHRAAPDVQSPLHPRHSALEVSELQKEQQRERLRRMCEDVAKRKRKEKGKGVVTECEQPPTLTTKRVSPRLAEMANALENRRSSRFKAEAHPRSVGATPATVTKGRNRSRSLLLEYAMYKGRAMCTPSYLLVKPPKNGDGDGEVVKAEVSVHRSELAKSVLNEECELVKNDDSENDDSENEANAEVSVQSDDDSENDDSENEANAEVPVHRSELAKWVLNEECELVENEDTKKRNRNLHEEVLFDCETDQYDCDMMIKMFEVIGKSFMNYYLKLQEPNNGQLPPIEELLLKARKKCIEEMYDKNVKAIMKAVKKNPAKALPALINWFVLKLEELRRHKIKTTPMWAQVYKKNFHLSLDYSSIDS